MSEAAVNDTRKRGRDEEETSSKRLRSFDADITVILKYEDDGKPCEKAYDMHGPILAMMSKFVDASLSINMKEKTTHTITLHDVTPEVFDMAIKYQEDPVASRSMTFKDALKVLPLYDKYEFPAGLRLCDHILSDAIQQHLLVPMEKPPKDLDKLAQAMSMAHMCTLPKALKKSITVMKLQLSGEADAPFSRLMWCSSHIEMLQALLLSDEILPMVKKRLDVSQAEVESPLFPKYFVKMFAESIFSNFVGNYILKKLSIKGAQSPCVDHLQLRRTENGHYSAECDLNWHYVRLIQIKVAPLPNGDWSIVAKDDDGNWHVLWTLPWSRNMIIPPQWPFTAQDKYAIGQPSISLFRH